MKTEFHHKPVNDQYGDPCVYVKMLREKRAFLFDIGDISRLMPSDIQKITDIFVTHTHIDHFIGFDVLLRAALRREQPLKIYGPDNIIDCIDGKLRGYAWNLITAYPVKIEVFGINKHRIKHASFYAENYFKRTDREESTFDGIISQELSFCVRAAVLSHGVPCLGFSLEEAFHINIDKAALERIGIPVGPWLSTFKALLRKKPDPDTKIKTGEREFRMSELMEIAMITKGQKLSYITDLSPDEENVRNAIDLVKESDTLYCEAFFLHNDISKAVERHHLTARLAGKIANNAGVKKLCLIHYSPRYKGQADLIEEEAMAEFNREFLG